MYCEQCGHPLVETARYCNRCGALQHPTPSPPPHGPGLAPGSGAGFGSGFESERVGPAVGPWADSGDVIAHSRRWVRYFARIFDFVVAAFMLGMVLGFVAPEMLENGPVMDNLFGLACLAAWVVIEPLFLTAWGATPGKLLFNTRIVCARGERLTYGRALARSARVWWRGLACGLPLVSLVTLIVAWSCLGREGITSWDRVGGTRVEHRPIGAGRGFLIAVLFIGFVALVVAGTLEES